MGKGTIFWVGQEGGMPRYNMDDESSVMATYVAIYFATRDLDRSGIPQHAAMHQICPSYVHVGTSFRVIDGSKVEAQAVLLSSVMNARKSPVNKYQGSCNQESLW